MNINPITKDIILTLSSKFGFAGKPLPIERDYLLNIIIYSLYQTELSNFLVFKGGTALKKIYFNKSLDDYRFSKDLDFTITKDISDKSLSKFIDGICEYVYINFGYNFQRIGNIGKGEYGLNSYSITIKLRNPSGIFSTNVRVKFDFKIDKDFSKGYSKYVINNFYKDMLPFDIYCNCENIDEIFDGKMNALFGEYKRTESRDFFDLINIIDRFGNKFDYKSIIKKYNIDLNDNRIKILTNNWDRFFDDQLSYIPDIKYYFEKFNIYFI